MSHSRTAAAAPDGSFTDTVALQSRSVTSHLATLLMVTRWEMGLTVVTRQGGSRRRSVARVSGTLDTVHRVLVCTAVCTTRLEALCVWPPVAALVFVSHMPLATSHIMASMALQ